jgi:hypothetical protein
MWYQPVGINQPVSCADTVWQQRVPAVCPCQRSHKSLQERTETGGLHIARRNRGGSPKLTELTRANSLVKIYHLVMWISPWHARYTSGVTRHTAARCSHKTLFINKSRSVDRFSTLSCVRLANLSSVTRRKLDHCTRKTGSYYATELTLTARIPLSGINSMNLLPMSSTWFSLSLE